MIRVGKKVLLGLILFATIVAGWILLKASLNTDSPIVVATSESMTPAIDVGDLLIVKGVDPEDVAVGTVIVFHPKADPGQLIVHRVVEVIHQEKQIIFITKGDNNPETDKWMVPANRLVGIVVGRIPYLGQVAIFARSIYGTVLIVVLIAITTILIFAEYRRSKRSENLYSNPEALNFFQ